MASVDKPRYGLELTPEKGAKTTVWYRTEEERSRAHRHANSDPRIKTAKRKDRK